jgi:glycosyltransferase involved in cell wall biosynthesis
VAAADVVILPYDNKEQISSGVLIEAVAAGRPVVATAFPHAIELLGGGAGIIVDHDDPAAMTEAIATLLTDELAYRRTADCAAELGKKLGWDAIAGRYTKLLSGLVATAGIVA